MDIGSIQSAIELTVLRRSLDMAADQAEHLIRGMESASPVGVGEIIDRKV